MSIAYQYEAVNLQEELIELMPFEDLIEPAEEMKASILWQLSELENTEQFPFIETIICSKHFDEFECMIKRNPFEEQIELPDFQTLILSSGYYNAFLGKSIDTIQVTIHIIDFITEEVYQTIQYPTM